MPRYKLRTLLIVLALTECLLSANPASGEPPPPPKNESLAQCRFVEGTAHHTAFDMTLYKIEHLNRIVEMKNAVVSSDGATQITPQNLPAMIASATPIDPTDKLFHRWHYSSYCSARFDYANGKWGVSLLRGGLGFLSNDQGYCGAFMYKLPPASTETSP